MKILEKMANEGLSLTSISKVEGYPKYLDLMKWKKEQPDFKKFVDLIRANRIDEYRDEMINFMYSKDILDRDELAMKNAQMSAGKYMMEKEVSGYKKSDAGSVGPGTINIILKTGFDDAPTFTLPEQEQVDNEKDIVVLPELPK